eukprot:2580091-Rhodomonas_salina.1
MEMTMCQAIAWGTGAKESSKSLPSFILFPTTSTTTTVYFSSWHPIQGPVAPPDLKKRKEKR